MTDSLTPGRAGLRVFGLAMILLAAATVLFFILNGGQGEGFCRADDTADGAGIMASVLAFGGLAVLLVGLLRKKYRGVRAAALLGWSVSLVPAVLLLIAMQHYVAVAAHGCPA